MSSKCRQLAEECNSLQVSISCGAQLIGFS